MKKDLRLYTQKYISSYRYRNKEIIKKKEKYNGKTGKNDTRM